MGKKNSGILYSLHNELWGANLKCGLTTQPIQKRISNLQTSLFIDCTIVYCTNELVNCKIYEYLLKKILKDYRIRKDREFYNIDSYDITEIYDNFNHINSILNTETKLNEYIKNNHPEYFNKKRKRTTESSGNSSNKPKKKKTYLFVDTSY